MKIIFGAIATAVVFGIVIWVMVSGKPNETPQQHPETTPPSQQTLDIDPKSVGGVGDPRAK